MGITVSRFPETLLNTLCPSAARVVVAQAGKANVQWSSQAYEEKDGSVSLDVSILTGGFTGAHFLASFGAYRNEDGRFSARLS